MRYLMIIKANEKTEAEYMPDETGLAEMAKYNEQLVKAGVMLDGIGLYPSSLGARVEFKPGKPPHVVDGPFAESKELVAGFWIIQVKTHEEAIEWAKRVPFNRSNTSHGEEGVIELRRIHELEDFDDSPAVQKHKELGKQLHSR